ncbi:MAG: hypothetical protein P4L57_08355 [Rhizomicrobium sp.]|nr:hypothetical protein [Rhizomicrobium sp.]
MSQFYRFKISLCCGLLLLASAMQASFASAPNEGLSGKALMTEGLAALRAGHPDDANIAFNRALKVDPRDPLLNFLNGFAYESGAGGAGERQDLSRIGYRLALQFDPNFWPATLQLGNQALRSGDGAQAKQLFASAAMQAPERAAPFYGLAAASYSTADLATARAALERATSLEAPNTPDRLRITALVRAATGDAAGAHVMLASLSAAHDPAAAFTASRIDTLGRNYVQLAAASEAASPPPPPPAPVLTSEAKRMANIDVIIIQRVEDTTDTRGVNLLSGLSMQFGSTLINVNAAKTTDLGAVTSDSKTISRALSLTVPAVTYSLNIANASDSFSRIQARPTLLAFDGQTSKFFNGDEITYTAGGTLSSTSYSKEVGLTLEVTPAFGAHDMVNLKVHTELSDFAPNSASTFKEALQITKTTTNVSAAMTYGQTLVVSGGTSTIESHSASGVPVLRDIPLVQNLFATASKNSREASLVVLLTLRRPSTPQERWSADGPFATDGADPAALAALKARYGAWFAQTPALTTLLARVSRQSPQGVFRAGDVRLANPAEADEDAATRSRFLDEVVTLFYY